MTMEIKGRHLIEGVPKTITITDEEIREALTETVNVIVDAVRVALERTPPELSADIVDRGIVLTGGGSMLKNLDKRLREETGLPLAMAEDPLSSVVLGAGQDAVGLQSAAEDFDRLGPLAGNARHRYPPAHGGALHRRDAGAHPADFGAGQLAAPACRCSRWSPSARSPKCSAARAGLTGGIRDAWSGYVNLRGVRAENEAAQATARRAAGAVPAGARARRACAPARERCSGFKQQLQVKTIAAGVIGAGASPDFRTAHHRRGHESRP